MTPDTHTNRAKGEGSIYQHTDGRWMYSIMHQGKRLTKSLGTLEHEAGLVGSEFEQNATGLAEVDGFGHLAIQHGRRPERWRTCRLRGLRIWRARWKS